MYVHCLNICIYSYVHCTLGWSDLALFAIFEKLHISADQIYFKKVNSKKSANFATPARQSSFSKNRRDLKKLIFFVVENLQKSS